ncbi:hypothetical protein [Marinobacter sp. P4B1]|uniref:hypothetical protein n=1 Tax=Marinobacter sp. P4B1 TaxID=1119533 RepID=UPI00071E17BB|nr:hypothetical protein [Marinobacter sp. P4B1]KRW83635.1 hypothetical protein AQ621_16435 [Marinobacter sp. P4B1]
MLRSLICGALLALFGSSLSFADDEAIVVSQGYGVASSVEDATELALTDAVKRATGALIVSRSVSTFDMTGHRGTTKTVGVVDGFVRNYDVVSVEDSGQYGRIRVTVDAEVVPRARTSDGNAQENPDIVPWVGEASRVAGIPEAQRKLREYQRVLEGFLGSPYDQLQAGYFISPRTYIVDMVGPDYVEGRVLVDVIVNTAYWNAYYSILQAMPAINPERSDLEGPLDDSKGVARNAGVAVDEALVDYLASPIPVAISFKSPTQSLDGVHNHPARIVLYKNSVFINHERVGTAVVRKSTSVDRPYAAPISERNSALTCSITGGYKYLYTCGTRFTVELPFKVQTEHQARMLFQSGVIFGLAR